MSVSDGGVLTEQGKWFQGRGSVSKRMQFKEVWMRGLLALTLGLCAPSLIQIRRLLKAPGLAL